MITAADAVDALPSRIREVLELHAFERLPYVDIAAQLDLSRSMVATQLTRAMICCLRFLADANEAHTVNRAAVEAAAGWFARLRHEDVTSNDHERFLRWLAMDGQHRRAWFELQRLWAEIASLATASAHTLPPPMEVEPRIAD